MGLPREAAKPVWTLTILIVIAWLVEVCGLLTLQWSCDDHERKDWYSYAQLPQAYACSKILRYLHWTTWLEFPLLVAVITALIGWLGAPFTPRASYNALNRYRMALIGLFAVATALQMWAANVTLNLADSDATAFLSQTELTRARITLAGYCATSAFNVLLIIALGDDGEPAAYEVLPPEPRSEPLRVTTPHTAFLSACLMPSTAGGCLSGSSTPSHSSASSRSSSASGSSMEERIRRAHSDPPLNLVDVLYVEPLTL